MFALSPNVHSMKKSINPILVLSMLLFTIAETSIAQSKITSSKKYKTSVTLLDHGPKITGYLKEVTNDSIKVISELGSPYLINKLAYDDIHELSFQKDFKASRILKGIFIGGLVGFGTGAIVGYAHGDDPPCNFFCLRFTAADKAGLGAILGIPIGIVAGGIAGLLSNYTKVTIPINGRKKFDSNKLTKYQLVF